MIRRLWARWTARLWRLDGDQEARRDEAAQALEHGARELGRLEEKRDRTLRDTLPRGRAAATSFLAEVERTYRSVR